MPSMNTAIHTIEPESIEQQHGREQDLSPHTPSTIILPTPQTFTLFPHLPPELRILVLHHALSNCYVTYRRSKLHPSFFNTPTPSMSHGGRKDQIYTYTHRLDKRKWMSLMMSCRIAYELVKGADEKSRKQVGSKEYWIYGRKWDEMVAFYRDNEEGGLKQFDSDPEFRW